MTLHNQSFIFLTDWIELSSSLLCGNITHNPFSAILSLQDPQPVSGSERWQKPPPAGSDAPSGGRNGQGTPEGQQRVVHTELPEPEALLHLVVKEGRKQHEAGPRRGEDVLVVWIEGRNPVSSVCGFQQR